MLEKKVMAAYEARKTANSLRSGAECQDIGGMCEDDMEQQQHASLPSLGRFEARYKYHPFLLAPSLLDFVIHSLPVYKTLIDCGSVSLCCLWFFLNCAMECSPLQMDGLHVCSVGLVTNAINSNAKSFCPYLRFTQMLLIADFLCRSCRQQFDQKCLGPGRERAQERLEKAWTREMRRFR